MKMDRFRESITQLFEQLADGDERLKSIEATTEYRGYTDPELWVVVTLDGEVVAEKRLLSESDW
jgi:hypothetical protein